VRPQHVQQAAVGRHRLSVEEQEGKPRNAKPLDSSLRAIGTHNALPGVCFELRAK
jgi:hypothetical protein